MTRNNASSQKSSMVSHEDRSSTRRTANGSSNIILKDTGAKDRVRVRRTHHPLHKHCSLYHYLFIPNPPSIESVKRHQSDMFEEWCNIKNWAKTITKVHAQRSPAETHVHRKMMQKKTIRTASPKIVRPVYTKPERPTGYVSTRTQKRIKAKPLYSLKRAPYSDDIEYYKRPKEYLKPRKHGPFIINTPKPKWNDAVRIVVNEQLLSKGIPYRLPPSFNLSSIYEGKRFTLGVMAGELVLKHIDRKTPQYVWDLQGKAQKILLLKNHPENDVVHVKSRSQRSLHMHS
jgi:hypothetical protein